MRDYYEFREDKDEKQLLSGVMALLLSASSVHAEAAQTAEGTSEAAESAEAETSNTLSEGTQYQAAALYMA